MSVAGQIRIEVLAEVERQLPDMVRKLVKAELAKIQRADQSPSPSAPAVAVEPAPNTPEAPPETTGDGTTSDEEMLTQLRLEAGEHGIRVDKRWGVDRLRAEIAEATK
jgi:hypothetical protein